MKLEKKRNSNFELLRILAMFMIVVFHITYHSIKPQLTDVATIALWNNGLFNHPIFYKKLLLITTILPFGKIGDIVFLLISGYFLINKSQIDLGKTVKKLLFPLVFAAVVLVVSSIILHRLYPDIFINLMSITNLNVQSWFIGYYFVVIVIAALFLNKFLSKLERKQYVTFLLVMFALITFGWSGRFLNYIAETLLTLVTGVFIYALGGFIRIYDPFKKVRPYVLILIWLVVYGLIYLSYYNTVQIAIQKYALSSSNKEFTQVLLTSFYDFSMVVIVLGVTLFELFKRIRIPHSAFINYLGSTTFTIYLLHDNEFFYSLWNTQDWITVLYYHPSRFVLKLALWALCVFAFGVLIHSLYLLLKYLYPKMKKLVIIEEVD